MPGAVSACGGSGERSAAACSTRLKAASPPGAVLRSALIAPCSPGAPAILHSTPTCLLPTQLGPLRCPPQRTARITELWGRRSVRMVGRLAGGVREGYRQQGAGGWQGQYSSWGAANGQPPLMAAGRQGNAGGRSAGVGSGNTNKRYHAEQYTGALLGDRGPMVSLGAGVRLPAVAALAGGADAAPLGPAAQAAAEARLAAAAGGVELRGRSADVRHRALQSPVGHHNNQRSHFDLGGRGGAAVAACMWGGGGAVGGGTVQQCSPRPLPGAQLRCVAALPGRPGAPPQPAAHPAVRRRRGRSSATPADAGGA